MGNGASCQACGSDKTLQSSESDRDSHNQTEYYGAALPGSDADDNLVRGGSVQENMAC